MLHPNLIFFIIIFRKLDDQKGTIIDFINSDGIEDDKYANTEREFAAMECVHELINLKRKFSTFSETEILEAVKRVTIEDYFDCYYKKFKSAFNK